ncbi:Major Facilitator Superfamily (MFS) [Phytophthora cinnamomi]|uniref:Major Facilitator Superfamily (MFS) n=1 Tax=Phytophthora cinnamomi TaxID=4785 RepID=UPI00355A2481|nr:Major Facilitator Superfamily (MFS) [Phytophthora cinnamomi]
MLSPSWLSGAFQWPVWASASCIALLLCLLLLHAVGKFLVVQKSSQNAAKEKSRASENKSFARFQHQYLVVFGLVMFADWLQGTHMYSLYQSYGVNVGALFLTGFLSSVVFGNFVAG